MTLLGALARMDEGRFRAELYRAWLVGQTAGFTPSDALEKMGASQSGRTEEMRRYLVVGGHQAKPLSALVKARPTLFEPIETALLAAADASGTLGTTLRLLADHFGREYRRMLLVKSQLSYLIFAGVIASFALAQPVLPRSGWRAYLAVVAVLLTAFLLTGGLPLGIIGGALARTSGFSRPRFARTLALGIEAGLPAGRAARVAAETSGSAELRAHLAKRSERDLVTMKLAALFDGCRAVPPALLARMAVADASADYLDSLGRYADEVDPKDASR